MDAEARRATRLNGAGHVTRLRLDGRWRGYAALTQEQADSDPATPSSALRPGDWLAALSDPEALFRSAVVVTDSPRSLVVRRSLRVGGRTIDVHIKRSRPGSLGFWPGRRGAARAFQIGCDLLRRGIPAAVPLAVLQRRRWGLLRESILITRTVVPVEPLNRFCHHWLDRRASCRGMIDQAEQRQLARRLPGQLGGLLRRLHAMHLVHRNLRADDLMVHWTPGGRSEIILVDLGDLSRTWLVTRRRRVRDLARLNVSLLACDAAHSAGRLRMLLGYLRRPGMRRIPFKTTWRQLEKSSARHLSRMIARRQRRQRKARR